MKTKLVGIGIVLMLLTTFLTVAQPLQKTQPTPTSTDDVPVWEVGDKWNYRIDDLTLDLSDENQSFFLYLSVEDLPLEVTAAAGDVYTLSFETTMNGNGHIRTTQGEGPINISVSFSELQIGGSISIDKTTLGITDFTFSFTNQKFNLNIIEQPFLTLPDWLKVLSVKMTTDLTVNSDTSVGLLKFPLTTGMFWNFSATNLTATGMVQSKLFTLIYIINYITTLLGRPFLPAEIAALLPVIDISQALNTFIGGNVIFVPVMTNVFYCPNTEEITVPAGTYQAFNISLFELGGNCYFAPAAGNIVRIQGNFENILPVINNINMQLISTTYE